MTYSQSPQSSGRYSAGTVATVNCDRGYGAGGDITCQTDANWSDNLPNCTSESVVIISYTIARVRETPHTEN